MEEDYHIVHHFSSYTTPLSGDFADFVVESKCALDEFPQAPDQNVTFGTGSSFGEEYDQLSPLLFDRLPIDDNRAYALFGIQSGDTRLDEGGPGLVAALDARPDGGSTDLAVSLKIQVQSDQRRAVLENRSEQPRSDSEMALPGVPATTRVSSGDGYRCIECPRYFKNGYLLEDHARVSKHKTYVCPEQGCSKKYSRRDVLRRHIATHTRSEIVCPVCAEVNRKRIFQRKDNLNQHLRIRHPEYSRHEDSEWRSSDQNQLLTVPETVDPVDFARREGISERCPLPPQRFWPNHSGMDTSMIEKSPCTTTAEIASALDGFLGDEDHIVVEIIQGHLGFGNQQKMEQLALSLARLALKEPREIPLAAREQLQQTSAKCFS